jgi:DNA-binding response OmpR family regulator
MLQARADREERADCCVVSDQSDDARGARAEARPDGRLLFVDPDELLVEMIASGLALSHPEWEVISTHHPFEALDVLMRYSQFNVLVTEVVFGSSSEAGRTFVREASRRWPDIPIFLMTRVPAEETRGLDAAEYIAKPPDMDFLVSRVERALRQQRQSLVRGISLMTFLQMLEFERKTCTVVVSHGGNIGEIYFKKGHLMQARFDALKGKEALFEILSMPDSHSLRVIDKCDAEPEISLTLSGLLMEWSVLKDHEGKVRPRSSEEDR